ncbi:hypothetical protein [Streptomyces galbus]|uniref:hypothetical protein n=1 Tax=Streptomyces galbus TaxID=33898 RepID=UPI003EBF50D3
MEPRPAAARDPAQPAPAPALLTLYGPHEQLPGHARPVTTGARTPYPVRAAARFTPADCAWTCTSSPRRPGPHPRRRHTTGPGRTTAPAAAGPGTGGRRARALRVRAHPQQAALFTGTDARPGTGRHVEQLIWVWHGPLDTERFTAAWQSVFDHESVLRTAFTGGPRPQLMVHSRVTVEITRRVHRAGDWSPSSNATGCAASTCAAPERCA